MTEGFFIPSFPLIQAGWGANERTRTAYPCSSYECAVTCCRGLQWLAIPVYLSRFLFSGLLRVAPYCAPDGIRVVSTLPRRRASPDLTSPSPDYVASAVGTDPPSDDFNLRRVLRILEVGRSDPVKRGVEAMLIPL